MSTVSNKHLVQDAFEQIAAGNPRRFAELLADDVVMRVTGQYSWSKTFRGKTALLRDLYGHLRTLLQEGSRTIAIRYIADGEYVAVEARGDMMTKTGERYDNEYCLIYRLSEGKIVEIREYCDSILCERVLGQYPAS